MKKKKANILYLSYDGMTDALGESQVLSYLLGLADMGNDITLISFEKKEAFINRGERIKKCCDGVNINWIPLSYTAWPPILSTLFDVYRLTKAINKLNGFSIIHCRGYITSLIGLSIKREKGTPFIFDMRGFWADEKLESGHWRGFLYRPVYNFFKKKEKEFFHESTIIISLTEAGKEEISGNYQVPSKKIMTIPTCVNQDIFKSFDSKIKESLKSNLSIAPLVKVMVYSGSLGGNYDTNILINAYQVFCEKYPDSRLLILTKTLEEDMPIFPDGIKNKIILKSVSYTEVADYLMIADIGFIFYKQGYSLIGRYPTKLGEYWSCGVPCVVYNKIGDINCLINQYPLYGLYYFDLIELNDKIERFDLNVDKANLRKVATNQFSLAKGIEFYNKVYNKILS